MNNVTMMMIIANWWLNIVKKIKNVISFAFLSLIFYFQMMIVIKGTRHINILFSFFPTNHSFNLNFNVKCHPIEKEKMVEERRIKKRKIESFIFYETKNWPGLCLCVSLLIWLTWMIMWDFQFNQNNSNNNNKNKKGLGGLTINIELNWIVWEFEMLLSSSLSSLLLLLLIIHDNWSLRPPCIQFLWNLIVGSLSIRWLYVCLLVVVVWQAVVNYETKIWKINKIQV